MKTNLLRKIRKRFSWAVEFDPYAGEKDLILFDDLKKEHSYMSSVREAMKTVLPVYISDYQYGRWLRKIDERSNAARYYKKKKSLNQ